MRVRNLLLISLLIFIIGCSTTPKSDANFTILKPSEAGFDPGESFNTREYCNFLFDLTDDNSLMDLINAQWVNDNTLDVNVRTSASCTGEVDYAVNVDNNTIIVKPVYSNIDPKIDCIFIFCNRIRIPNLEHKEYFLKMPIWKTHNEEYSVNYTLSD